MKTFKTVEGAILWPYSSQVTSAPFAMTVPRGKHITSIIQSNLSNRDTKGTEQNVPLY